MRKEAVLSSQDKRAPADDKSPWRHFLANNVQVLILYGFLIVAITGLCIYSPAFRFAPNLWTVARQAVIPAIIGMGQTFIIISGGIDLSVASMVTLVSLICSGLMNGQLEMFLPITGLMIVLGIFVGSVNGIISYRWRVPPFITTLGMALLLQGAALAYTRVPKGGVPRLMGDLLYYNTLGSLPYPIISFAIIFAICLFILHRTAFGRALFAIGGDQEVARRSGINVGRTFVMVFCLGSLLTTVGALMSTARMGIGDPLAGMGMELDSITAVVIGGTSLFGGRGNLFGTLAGVIILVLINNVMVILGVNIFYQQLIKGFVVLMVVALYKQRA
jgi:ribose transport system permease protein